MILPCKVELERLAPPVPAIALTGSDSPEDGTAWVITIPDERVSPTDRVVIVPWETPSVDISDLMEGGYAVSYDVRTLPEGA